MSKFSIGHPPRDLYGAKAVSLKLKKNKKRLSLKQLTEQLGYKSVEDMCKMIPLEDLNKY